MIDKRIALLGAFACLPLFAQEASPQDNAEKIAPRQFAPIHDRVDHSDGTSTSTNWSGYAVTGTSFTSVIGSWVVPTATCTGVEKDEYAAFWVGIDGYSSSTVEQTGTDSDCDRTTPSYYAWYEFYPNPSIEITSLKISPGNKVSASVTYASGKFTITITNETTGKSYTKSSTVSGADRSSAEWITEAPCCTAGGGILPLSDFGTVKFGDDYTSVAGTNSAADSTKSGDIASFGSVVEEINKTASSSSPETSTCSALSSDGTSFTCTWAK
jgi:hypothetical protein